MGGATGRHLSLSGDYMQRIPGGSPSLRHPTRMLKSIENEDTKSAQGSRISIPGSKTSIQGSRPSMFSSQGSFLQSGSRSQIFNHALSNEPVSLSRGGGRRDDDTLSLPLSGRTTSPPLQQSSLNSSFEVPTRDEPSTQSHALSHDLGVGAKDFASMTDIAQHSILSPELGTVRVPMDLDPAEPPSETVSTRRRSLINCDLGALTTIADDKSKSEAKASPPEAPKKDNDTPKKSRSKMSKLEMLTSLRASMRKAAKKVSFKSKKQKDASDGSTQLEQEATPTRDRSTRRHSDILENPLPNSVSSAVDPRGMRPRAYTDLVVQLSQPNLYFPSPAHAYHAYQQLSQSYPIPAGPYNDFFGPASHQPLPEDYPPRYAGVITPDYSDLTTPDHHYSNPNRTRTPDQYLDHNDSGSDDYPQQNSTPRRGGATSPSVSYTSNEGGDPFSMNSDLYRSPVHGGMGKPLPTVHEKQYQFDDVDILPPYNPDPFMGPSRRGGEDMYMGGASMYPPPAMYPGNGYPIPPSGEYFEDMRRNSLDRGFRGLDQMGTFHERKSSYDQNGGDFPHQRRGSYDQGAGDFPHPHPYHPRRESHDYEVRDNDNRRRSILSDNSDLSASRNRVSWNTEVIEYARTPSDGSDLDLNEL